MKRFLILFILIFFVTVSCAGPNKVGWTKHNFRQDEFDKDQKECIQTANKESYSQTSGVIDDCMALKGYESEPEPSSDIGKPKTAEIAKQIGKALLIITSFTALAAAMAALVVLSAL